MAKTITLVKPDGTEADFDVPENFTPEQTSTAIKKIMGAASSAASDKAIMNRELPWMAETTPKQPVDLHTPRSPEQVQSRPPQAPDNSQYGIGNAGIGVGKGSEISAPVPEWKQVLKGGFDIPLNSANSVHVPGYGALPDLGTTLGTAAGVAGTIGTEGASAATIPVAGAAGHWAGRGVENVLDQLLGFKAKPIADSWQQVGGETLGAAEQSALEGMMAHPEFIPGVAGLPNTVKELTQAGVGKLVGRAPQRIVAEQTGLAPSSRAVENILESPSVQFGTGKMQETAKAARAAQWPKVEGLVNQAADSGQTISRDLYAQAIQDEINNLLKVGAQPTHPEILALQEELQNLPAQYKPQLTPWEAQGLKQRLYQRVSDFEKSPSKESAMRPLKSAERGAASNLDVAIGETTGAPEAYDVENLKYGRLAQLLQGKEGRSPAAKADVYATTSPKMQKKGIVGQRAAGRTIGRAAARPMYGVQQWAGETPEVTPPTAESLFSQDPYYNLNQLLTRGKEAFREVPTTPVRQSSMESPWAGEEVYQQQMQPEGAPSIAMESTYKPQEVPVGDYTNLPEGYGQMKPGIEGYEPEVAGAHPEITPGEAAGTLMEWPTPETLQSPASLTNRPWKEIYESMTPEDIAALAKFNKNYPPPVHSPGESYDFRKLMGWD